MLIDSLSAKAKEKPRLRQAMDLRNSPEDLNQRMLNALEPGLLCLYTGTWLQVRLDHAALYASDASIVESDGGGVALNHIFSYGFKEKRLPEKDDEVVEELLLTDPEKF